MFGFQVLNIVALCEIAEYSDARTEEASMSAAMEIFPCDHPKDRYVSAVRFNNSGNYSSGNSLARLMDQLYRDYPNFSFTVVPISYETRGNKRDGYKEYNVLSYALILGEKKS